jgi:hypothetical protein
MSPDQSKIVILSAAKELKAIANGTVSKTEPHARRDGMRSFASLRMTVRVIFGF